jgi:hypothetical protein
MARELPDRAVECPREGQARGPAAQPSVLSRMRLEDAPQAIASDWIAAYQQFMGEETSRP